MAICKDEEGVKYISSGQDFKKAITEKFVNRGSKTANMVAEETGVTIKTLYNWADKYSNDYPMKKQTRSTFEKMRLVIEFNSLPDDDRGEFLRSKGLYEEEIKSWEQEVLNGEIEKFTENLSRKQLKESQDELKKVKRDLNKKEKALAEAAALLILKKKAEAFWGEDEE